MKEERKYLVAVGLLLLLGLVLAGVWLYGDRVIDPGRKMEVSALLAAQITISAILLAAAALLWRVLFFSKFSGYVFNCHTGSWIHKRNQDDRICTVCKQNDLFSRISREESGFFVCPVCGHQSFDFPYAGPLPTGALIPEIDDSGVPLDGSDDILAS